MSTDLAGQRHVLTAHRLAHAFATTLMLVSLTATAVPLSAQPLRHSPRLSLSRFPIPDSRVPTPDPRVPTPDSRVPTPQPPPDHWFARDKVRHFGTSAAIQLMGYGMLRIVGAGRGGAMVGAAIVSASAGVGKEIWDSHGNGIPSGRDLVWDGLGIIAGGGLARIGEPP